MGSEHTEVLSPSATAFIGFAAQIKLAQFESTGSTALYPPLLFINPGDARGRNFIGRDVLTTPLFTGPFGRLISA